MRSIAFASLCLATLLTAGCATRAEFAELPMAPFEHPASVLHATSPRTPDGRTAFAMTALDTSRNQPLQAYRRPQPNYPSVGGDILRGAGQP